MLSDYVYYCLGKTFHLFLRIRAVCTLETMPSFWPCGWTWQQQSMRSSMLTDGRPREHFCRLSRRNLLSLDCDVG
jgi:hypothetical protein